MSILRVLLAEAPSPALAAPWAMFDADGRHTRSGVGPPASWPDAQRKEAVLAASAVRLVGVALPPMPADRVASAAAFALEDQLAGPAHAQHLVAANRRRDGTVEVAIVARALMGPLRSTFARVVAEPATAPVPAAGTWRWCESGLDGGFVRKPDGGAFAVSAPGARSPVPAELALALKQAARPGVAVDVAFPADDAQLAAWSAQCGVAFRRVAAWRWDQDGAALAAATDLLQGEFSREAAVPARTIGSRFRFAAAIAIAALGLHVAATFVQWAWLRVDSWRTAGAIVAAARDAGVAEAAGGESATAALARKFADARHRAAQPAPSDALPMLARAAPALAALPAGALKTATYTRSTWTFELAKVDAGAAAALDRAMTGAGLATLQATTNAGTRVRATLAPGTDGP
ncbi:MAG: type II secretion system protein GspL [Burkholderiales bacterium]